MKDIYHIYFSGPDGSHKTPLSFALYEWLRFKGVPVELYSFPSRDSIVGGLLRNCLDKRLKRTNSYTRGLLFATDRSDLLDSILEIKENNPHTVFIFDRGPFDGEVFNFAQATMEHPKNPYALEDAEIVTKNDTRFLRTCPVDLGFLCMSSLDQAQKILTARNGLAGNDTYEDDLPLQERIRREYLNRSEGKEEWVGINVPVEKPPEEAKREMMGIIFRDVATRMGKPEWTCDEARLDLEIGFLAKNAGENGLLQPLSEEALYAYQVTSEGGGFRQKER
jgi:thymidylate kinase